jgi:tetratricopeptide (TPR) repeat protein
MSDLVQQGIDALKDGDRDTAHDLLTQATQDNPDNAKAWYYLAAAAKSEGERRQALERVVEIMPENEKARAALAKMDAEAQASQTSEAEDDFEAAMNASSDNINDKVVDARSAEHNRSAGASAGKSKAGAGGGTGFALPVEIPGAPQRVDPQAVVMEFRDIFMNGINILRGDVGAYQAELRQASWWRFWMVVVVGGIIGAILSTISGILIASQLAALAEELSGFTGIAAEIAQPNILNILGSLILTAPLGVAAMYGGLYASNWWLTEQNNGSGALFEFAYAVALPVTVATVISNVLGLIGAFLPFLSVFTGLAALVVGIVGWWRAVQGMATVHNVPVQWTAVIALVIFIIAQVVVGFVLGLVFSPFLIASSGLGLF